MGRASSRRLPRVVPPPLAAWLAIDPVKQRNWRFVEGSSTIRLVGEMRGDMRKLLGSVLCACLIASAPAAAQPSAEAKAAAVDPSSLAMARQIVTIAFPTDRRSQMFASTMDAIVDQSRKSMESLHLTSDKDLQAVIDRSTQRMFDQLKASMNAALPDYFESVAHAYARNFSLDDLNAILAFVKTPAGQHYFSRAPLLLKDPDVAAATQRMVAQMMSKMPEINRENMQDIEDYVARKAKQEKGVVAKPVT
jgi:hypothetical protein